MLTQTDVVDLLVEISYNSSSISEDFYFTLLSEKYQELTNKLKGMSIDFENMGDTIICLNKSFIEEHNVMLYCSIDSFFRKYEETTNVILILGNKKVDSFVSFIDTNNCIRFRETQNEGINHDTTNFVYLKKIIKLLSEPRITDYKDSLLERYFFLSPECGKLEINEGDISNLINIAKNDINLYEIYIKLNTMFGYPKGWEYILKNKIIRGLESIDIKKDGFKELILNLSKFIDATERDYELFLTSKKHETIVQQFENEKYVFIDKIRSVLQRISSSIISIPLTFFGASFAMREIDKLWLLNIVVISIILYISFSIAVFFLLWSDLDNIKEEISTKKNIISMGLSYLQNDLNEIIKPLNKRILSLKILVATAIILFALIFLFFIYQYTNQEPPHA